MTAFEIVELFTVYGVDVVVLAAITSALTQILKKTVLKNAPNKLYTFLPFVIGVILYILYAMISRVSFCYVTENFVEVFGHGMSVGSVATVLYVMYEQFVRGRSSTENDDETP